LISFPKLILNSYGENGGGVVVVGSQVVVVVVVVVVGALVVVTGFVGVQLTQIGLHSVLCLAN